MTEVEAGEGEGDAGGGRARPDRARASRKRRSRGTGEPEGKEALARFEDVAEGAGVTFSGGIGDERMRRVDARTLVLEWMRGSSRSRGRTRRGDVGEGGPWWLCHYGWARASAPVRLNAAIEAAVARGAVLALGGDPGGKERHYAFADVVVVACGERRSRKVMARARTNVAWLADEVAAVAAGHGDPFVPMDGPEPTDWSTGVGTAEARAILEDLATIARHHPGLPEALAVRMASAVEGRFYGSQVEVVVDEVARRVYAPRDGDPVARLLEWCRRRIDARGHDWASDGDCEWRSSSWRRVAKVMVAETKRRDGSATLRAVERATAEARLAGVWRRFEGRARGDDGALATLEEVRREVAGAPFRIGTEHDHTASAMAMLGRRQPAR